MGISNNQQQTNILSSSTNGVQLTRDDENYIEKLFPKCSPKQLVQTRTNNFRMHRSSFRAASNNRRQQQHQQQQRQKYQDKVSRLQQQPIESKTPISASNNDMTYLSNQQSIVDKHKFVADKPNRGNRNVKLKKYPSSSDSSASENGVGTSYELDGLKVNECHNFDDSITEANNRDQILHNCKQIDLNNSGRAQTGNKHQKTRKYTASKNLQKQLEKSLSNSKLNSKQSLNRPESLQADFGNKQNQIDIGIEMMINGNTSNSSSLSTERLPGNNPKMVNRTCKGIVFSELPQKLTIDDSRLQASKDIKSSNMLDTNHLNHCDEGQISSKDQDLLNYRVKASIQTLYAQTTSNDRQNQQKANVLDLELDSSSQYTNEMISTENPCSNHLMPATSTEDKNNNLLNKIVDTNNDNDNSNNCFNAADNPLAQTKSVLNEDDDKYINLFVYDNTMPASNGCGNQELVTNKPYDESINNHSSIIIPSERHHLPTLDLCDHEQDMIKNDTSVEELCAPNDETNIDDDVADNVVVDVNNNKDNDNDANNSLSRGHDKNVVEEESNTVVEHISIDDQAKTIRPSTEPGSPTAMFSSVGLKNQQKHHRLVGILQTVDEKAEIVVESGSSNNNKHSDTPADTITSKIELIDINKIPEEEEEQEATIEKIQTSPVIRPYKNQSQSKLLDEASQIDRENYLKSLSADSCSSNLLDNKQFDPISEFHDKTPINIEKSNLSSSFVVTSRDQCKQLGLNPQSESTNNVICSPIETSGSNKGDLVEFNRDTSAHQHHKLPNETSHYSISRFINRAQDIRQNQKTRDEIMITRSRVQFDALLSDAESEGDERHDSNNSNTNITLSKTTTESNQETISKNQSVRNAKFSSTTTNDIDDDSIPVRKTALVFPRLDEGLSSDAESNDDEPDEDDDRAMEADVDADDDEDEDDNDNDDEDDDDENENENDEDEDIDTDYVEARNIMGLDRTVQSNVHSLQAYKPQNRLTLNLHQKHHQQQQQQQHHTTINTPSEVHTSQSDIPSIKGSINSPYANLLQDQAELADLKPITASYPDQNGQSNYWMGSTSGQTTSIPALLSPANHHQYGMQRNQMTGVNNINNNNNNINNINNNNNNGINANRSNNYQSNRDETKSISRLSSDTDNETDRLLGSQRNEQLKKMANNEIAANTTSGLDNQTNNISNNNNFSNKFASNSREVLIEGVLFNVKYLGSTHTECEGRGEKEDRIHQAELAVHEVKFRNGDGHSAAIEVQLFISTEKIMVLDDKHRKIMMDHSLRTISYIADIGDAIVLIVRKKGTSMDVTNELGRPVSKTSCHVFESNESHTITKSISQAFQVAYTELLKANGASDTNNYLPKELDYQEVLNSQEMSMTELEMFARKDNQREVIVPKQMNEILGISIVESGWGSVLPTAVIAGLKQDGPAYRCKKLSVGDQILSINGISLVGLSLAECQKILRKTKKQSVARLSVVPCPITVEVKIKRPDTKYQLGFSVQHGVICSLLRGGIAERGGVRVGHRIISINGTTVVGVPHDKIVTLLASSVGEIRMKTCLTSLYRHMLGEEKNVSFV